MKLLCIIILGLCSGLSSEANRIIGGTPVSDVSELPYQLSLRNFGQHKCGASIISANWALSAGHCVNTQLPLWAITFLAGVLNIESPSSVNIFDVEELHRHPNYDATMYDYDVAVFRVTRSFFEVPKVQAIRLSTQNMPLVTGEISVISGWGVTETGYLSNDLLQTGVPIVAENDCRAFWGSKFTDRMICAGGKTGFDSCVGDSGGPLVFRNLQVGIVSFGPSDCGTQVPAGYTKIANPSVRQFIRTLTGV
ncbi:trypsin-2-like [Culicoides brevitarsis]|uniref:trypsin-2-like n=1 Tax=Culicoides brevitarsis TaxID=469753 RepID=UPI00307B9117